MSAKVLAFEQIKRLMGWCPACRKIDAKNEQTFCFANQPAVSGKKRESGAWPDFRTSNVTYPANSALFCLLFAAGFNLLPRTEDLPRFLAGLILLNAIYYWFSIKSLSAKIQLDSRGVNMQSFRMREFKLPYREIESIVEHKLEKRSKKSSLLLFILGGIAVLCIAACMVLEGEDRFLVRLFVLTISILPLTLFWERNQKTRYHDLNTQLYIKTRRKKWYEWSSYYSIITDEASAAELKSSIERHL